MPTQLCAVAIQNLHPSYVELYDFSTETPTHEGKKYRKMESLQERAKIGYKTENHDSVLAWELYCRVRDGLQHKDK